MAKPRYIISILLQRGGGGIGMQPPGLRTKGVQGTHPRKPLRHTIHSVSDMRGNCSASGVMPFNEGYGPVHGA